MVTKNSGKQYLFSLLGTIGNELIARLGPLYYTVRETRTLLEHVQWKALVLINLETILRSLWNKLLTITYP